MKVYEKYLTEQKVKGKVSPIYHPSGKEKARVSKSLLENSVKVAEDRILSDLDTLRATSKILREWRLDVTHLTPKADESFRDVDFALTKGVNLLRNIIKKIPNRPEYK